MLRASGSPTPRQAGNSSPAPSSPAAKLRDQINLLRQRYWFFMSQTPPRVKAANACLLALQPLMQKQLERENREDRRLESVLRADERRRA